MQSAEIFTEQQADEGDRILASLGISRSDVKQIAAYSRQAYVETSPYMPLTAPGTNAYHHGVEALRSTLIDRVDWRLDRQNGIESVVNDKTKVQLLYQNVHSACTVRDPQPISPKGPVSRELVNSGQGDMFDPPQDGDIRPKGLSYAVWIVCVCHRSDNVCVEVSRPLNFSGKRYEGFHQRVFIADSPLEDLGASFDSTTDEYALEENTADPKVPVTRKKAK